MSNSVDDFLKNEEWFRYGPECEELLLVFYMLYWNSCELQGESPLTSKAFIKEFPRLGLTRVGNYVRGVKLTESGERLGVAAAVLAQHEQEEEAEEGWSLDIS